MTLYEITNGWHGESYCRCYVWANNEEEASRLYRNTHRNGYPIKEIRELMKDTDEPFCTQVSDEGWER